MKRLPSSINKWVYLLIPLTTLLIYIQIVNHEFINFDTYQYVVDNPNINSGVSWDNVAWAFTETRLGNWHPLTWLSHMLDVELYGLSPGGHHVSSLIIHLLNCCLLLLLLHRITKDFWPSALVAMLFAIHPLHVESIAWVAERKDVLSTLFFLLTLIFYHQYTQRNAASYYCLSLLLITLGLLSKPMLVTLPFIMLLLDYWPLQRMQAKDQTIKQLTIEKIPFFIIIIISIVVTYLAQSNGGAMSSGSMLSWVDKFSNAVIAYARYIKLAIAPSNLNIYHPHPGQWPVIYLVISTTLLVTITAVSIASYKRKPYLIVGWLFFIGALIPVIGIIQVGAQSIAERYTYIPYIGLFIMFAWSMQDIWEALDKKRTHITVGIGLLLILYSLITLNYLHYWKNDIRLFQKTLLAYDSNYINILSSNNESVASSYTRTPLISYAGLSLVYNNIGISLQEAGLLNDAKKHLEQAIYLHPADPKPYYNLAMVYEQQHNYHQAYAYLSETIRLDPKAETILGKMLEQFKSKIKQN